MAETQAITALETRIQNLCQELQDMILEELLAAQIPQIIVVEPDYNPPAALQLNRKTRAKFSKVYYDRLIYIDYAHWNLRGRRRRITPYRFISTLGKSHLALVRCMQITAPDSPHENYDTEPPFRVPRNGGSFPISTFLMRVYKYSAKRYGWATEVMTACFEQGLDPRWLYAGEKRLLLRIVSQRCTCPDCPEDSTYRCAADMAALSPPGFYRSFSSQPLLALPGLVQASKTLSEHGNLPQGHGIFLHGAFFQDRVRFRNDILRGHLSEGKTLWRTMT